MSRIIKSRIELPDTRITNSVSHRPETALCIKQLNDIYGKGDSWKDFRVFTETITKRTNVRLVYRQGGAISISEDRGTAVEKIAEIGYYLPECASAPMEAMVETINDCIEVDSVLLTIYAPRGGGFHNHLCTIHVPNTIPPSFRVTSWSRAFPDHKDYAENVLKEFWNKYQKKTTLFFELLRQIK